MTVTVKVLISPKVAENSQTTQYTVPTGVTTIIDKFTATNYSASAAQISVNLVPYGGSAGNSNISPKEITLQPSQTYIFPEIVGRALSAGSFISTLAGTASSINIQANGREITQ